MFRQTADTFIFIRVMNYHTDSSRLRVISHYMLGPHFHIRRWRRCWWSNWREGRQASDQSSRQCYDIFKCDTTFRGTFPAMSEANILYITLIIKRLLCQF